MFADDPEQRCTSEFETQPQAGDPISMETHPQSLRDTCYVFGDSRYIPKYTVSLFPCPCYDTLGQMGLSNQQTQQLRYRKKIK